MKFSKYNIYSKIRDSENYFIVNLLSGNADIVTGSDAGKIEAVRKGDSYEDEAFIEELTMKGYIVDESDEARLFREKYLDFVDAREKDEIQIFFVPNYSCNFACSYCYQDQYLNPAPELRRDVIDAFFDYVKKEFSSRRKYITVFGGEPLLNSPQQKEMIDYFIGKSVEADLSLCFVTNGYYLGEYVPALKIAKIREIQVTLDGTSSVHDKRRFLKNGGPTFEKIVRGIDACLTAGININLRVVIDRENIENLSELARFAIDKGWTDNELFKTQIGRNYELHHCQSSPDKLFDRISLYERLYDLIKKHPHITKFHKPAYSISKFLAENGELPDPLFDSCPACKTEWAFDYTGNIYSCTATVGKTDESLGTFYPVISRKNSVIEEWESRDVTSINDCKECSLQLACGGGCGSIAKNKTGNICSPDCRPVRELMELGFAEYFS
ncbi:MAG TPA: radical SAM protein [Bacteroidales bacterium]|nr:radical SAM protein [Bacteroidales bacterium]HOX73820.1 radical SAM protein [Bacteroidales bacterium]HPM88255.1 radical SAM protein [Bacteroidales bacterium]HQM68382.1 radical SAM protein [Bacteroidales bacterium]